MMYSCICYSCRSGIISRSLLGEILMFSVFGEQGPGSDTLRKNTFVMCVKTLIGQTQKYQTDAADDQRRETDENEHCA